jgi:DNA-binding CsgD family transcriptional regulator
MLDQDIKGFNLGRLNEAERNVLRLLAEGHTAKTVANELGLTTAAVNERLREARRKTGVGSSRQLARLLKTQENRHDEMGVVASPTPGNAPSTTAAGPRRRRLGAITMLTISIAAIAGAAALMGQDAKPSNEPEPLIGAPLERFKQPADLHAQIRSETRDDAWAPQMERAIRTRLLQIPLVGVDGNELRITCAKTLCEIAGTLLAPASAEERDDMKSPVNKTITALQVPPLPDDLAKLGLKSESASFTGAKGKPDRSVFLLYYSRVQG